MSLILIDLFEGVCLSIRRTVLSSKKFFFLDNVTQTKNKNKIKNKNETKRNKTKQNKTKHKTKQGKTKQNENKRVFLIKSK